MDLNHLILIAVAAGLLMLAAELLHTRRIKRLGHLAFPRKGQPHPWVLAVPPLRALAAAMVCFGLLALLQTDGRAATTPDRAKLTSGTKHLLLVMDVSPSMFEIKDAGATGKQTRRERARDVVTSLLSRLDTTRMRVSMIAFWEKALPVVIDTFDLNVITNAVGDLPLHYAFSGPRTDLNAGVALATKLAEPWAPGSATIVVISDGGDAPKAQLPPMPPSVADCIVLGVGNPFRSSPVGDTTSRQDRESLQRLAVQLRGQYQDVNTSHVSSLRLGSLKMLAIDEKQPLGLRTIGLILLSAGSSILGLLPILLTFFGAEKPRPAPITPPAAARPSRGGINEHAPARETFATSTLSPGSSA